MKKSIIIAVTALFILGMGMSAMAKTRTSETAVAGNLEMDGSFGFATGPGSFDAGYGLNFGAGYTLSQVDKNLQIRADLSYFDFSYSYGYFGNGYDLSYVRVPLTVGARYYFPIIPNLKAFAQAGLETSIDSFDYVDVFGNKHSKSEINLGITPGGGVEYFLNRNVSFFAVGRWHLITDSYFSMQFGAAYHF